MAHINSAVLILFDFFFFLKLFFLIINPALYCQQNQLVIKDFQVNENAGWCNHFNPRIAMHPDGSFIIVWHDYKNTHADIYLQCYDNKLNRIGNDILVNDDGGLNDQLKPDIDIDINGGFVVTWIDERSGKGEIYAQRFDSLANPLGRNFLVNEGKGDFSEYSNPSIALSGEGNFVITWLENQYNEFGVYAKLYLQNGEQITNSVRVNDQNNPVSEYSLPDVGMDDMGNFVVVFSQRVILAQRFDMNGNKLGNNFKVNDDDNDRYHGEPTVSVFPEGDFVVTWIDERNYFYDIYAQRFDAHGARINGNFIVNDVAGGQQFTPIVCTSSTGRFVISWKDPREGGILSFDIFSQVYDEDGTPIGSNFKIQDDENSMYYLTPPTSDMDSTGNFIIAWNQRCIGMYQIFAQKFDPEGNRIEATFRVNDDEGSGNQINPVISAMDNGSFFVAWEDDRNGNKHIYLQGFSIAGEPLGENCGVSDTTNASIQSSPQMGVDAQGNLFVVWQDYRDGNRNVYGQRFDEHHLPVGANFRINENNPESGTWFPKIAMNRAGNSVVVWFESDWTDMDICSTVR